MDFNTKVTRLIAKLNLATIDNEIEWQLVDPPKSLVSGTDDIVPSYFVAEYSNRTFVVFERRSRHYDGYQDMFYWASAICFGVVDSADRVIWETSQPTALHHLYSTITEQASRIHELFDDILEQDDSPGKSL